MDQKARVLAALRTGKRISQLQFARMRNPILRLGARIWELRQQDYQIDTLYVRTKWGGYYAYQMREP